MTMEIKTISPVSVLVFTTKTTLAGLYSYVGTVAAELYKEAIAQQLLPSGPITWLYYGADGKAATEFILEIALPVQGTPRGESTFVYKSLPSFYCASFMHYGDWSKMPDTYQKSMTALAEKRANPSGVTREQYISFDFQDASTNITEIQIGV